MLLVPRTKSARRGAPPKSRLEYWGPKLEANKCRDEKSTKALEAQGWSVMVVWQCETKDLPIPWHPTGRLLKRVLKGNDTVQLPMSAHTVASHNSVDASPTKRFFVDMLNSGYRIAKKAVLGIFWTIGVDGLMRSSGPYDPDAEKPYAGHWAKNNVLSGDSFTITDNCGGISRKLAEESAFRMGRIVAVARSRCEHPHCWNVRHRDEASHL